MINFRKRINRMLVIYLILMVNLFFTIRAYSIFAPLQVLYINILDIGRCLYFMMSLLLLIPFVAVYDYYLSLHDGSVNFIIQRIGYKNFYRKAFKDIFLTTFLFMIVLHVLVLLTLLLTSGTHLGGEMNQMELPQLLYFYGNNMIVNDVLLVFFSSTGTAILACFLFSIGHFIKNKYVFVSIPLILVFTLTMFIIFILYPFLDSLFEYSRSYTSLTVLFSILPVGLVSPGAMYSTHGILNFMISSAIYLSVTLIFKVLGNKKLTKQSLTKIKIRIGGK